VGTALRFKSTSVPRQQGELARLKVVQGPDFGAMYVVCGGRATIGRGEENDVVLSDLRSSRKHAEVSVKDGAWQVRDLGSANGILHNGSPVKASPIRSSDTLTVGETTLEFMASTESGTAMLTAPGRVPSGSPNTQLGVAYKDRISAVRAPGSVPSSGPRRSGAPRKVNPAVLVVAVVGVGALFFFDDQGEPKKLGGQSKVPVSEDVIRELSSYLPDQAAVATMNKSAESFYRAGFREYRNGNYLRAKLQFENALQVMPGHSLAGIYLKNCDLAIDRTVKKHLELGKKNYDAGKYKTARGHFESIQRLLYRNQSSTEYVEASEQLAKIVKEMKEGGG
jgi:hypothetical protein